jgi:hypothetical protein
MHILCISIFHCIRVSLLPQCALHQPNMDDSCLAPSIQAVGTEGVVAASSRLVDQNHPVHAIARHACLKPSLRTNLSPNWLVTVPGVAKNWCVPSAGATAEALHDSVLVREHRQEGGFLERGKRELKDFDEGRRVAKGLLLDRDQLFAAGPVAVIRKSELCQAWLY